MFTIWVVLFTSLFSAVLSAPFPNDAKRAATDALQTDLGNVQTIVTQLGGLSNELTTADDQATTIVNALLVLDGVSTLTSAMNSVLQDVIATSKSSLAPSFPAVLADFQAFQPTFISTLSSIATKVPEFQALQRFLPSSNIKTNLVNLEIATSAVEVALLVKAPVGLLAPTLVVDGQIDAALRSAIQALSKAGF